MFLMVSQTLTLGVVTVTFERCSHSGKLLREPNAVASCEHYFCRYARYLLSISTSTWFLLINRGCILSSLGTHCSCCPKCGLPTWVKDMKPSHQLASVISNLHLLRSLVITPLPSLLGEVTTFFHVMHIFTRLKW